MTPTSAALDGFSKESVDDFTYQCRWWTTGLILLLSVLRDIEPFRGSPLGSFAGTLALVLVPVGFGVLPFVASCLMNSEGVRRKEEDAFVYKDRYGLYLRLLHHGYHFFAFVAAVVASSNLSAWINGTGSVRDLSLGIGMLLPPAIACSFSRRLIRANVTEIEYIKGTTTCREVAILWVITILLTFQSYLEKPDESGMNFDSVMMWALTFLALARILSVGYKEFREAINSAPDTQGQPQYEEVQYRDLFGTGD